MATAALYRDTSTHQTTQGKELIELLTPQKGMKVLDLGCGTGYLASIWADLVGTTGSVIGVDPDEGRIKLAVEKYSDRDNLKFCKGSTYDFPQQEYDVIFCNLVLHWVKDKDAAFANVHGNLRSGGRFSLVAVELMLPMFDEINDLMGEERSKELRDKWGWKPLQYYEELAYSAGFRVELSRSTARRMEFSDINALMEWWRGTTHGYFDEAHIEEPMLSAFKSKYGVKPIVVNWPFVVMILVKD